MQIYCVAPIPLCCFHKTIEQFCVDEKTLLFIITFQSETYLGQKWPIFEIVYEKFTKKALYTRKREQIAGFLRTGLVENIV